MEAINIKRLAVTVHTCGMGTGKTFTDTIIILASMCKVEETYIFEESQLGEITVRDILEQFKSTENFKFDNWTYEHISIDHVYIWLKDSIYGLQNNKLLKKLFDFFSNYSLGLLFFIIAGGASMHCHGYRFTVHPDEIYINTLQICMYDTKMIAVDTHLKHLRKWINQAENSGVIIKKRLFHIYPKTKKIYCKCGMIISKDIYLLQKI